MISPRLAAAFAAGATIVTPNNRLARALAGAYDEAQRAAGLRTWPAANALPWPSLVARLWQDALAEDAAPTPLLSPLQSRLLWERVVAAAPSPPLLDPAGAAAHAADAWSLFHAWRRPGETYAGWAHAGRADDAAAFAQWAGRYAETVAERGFVDAATAVDALAAGAAALPAVRDAHLIVAGFIELSPQQQRLLAALAAAGMRVERDDAPAAATGAPMRVEGANPHDEIVRALSWARAQARAAPGAAVGIVIEDLALRREEVTRLADDILCPAAIEQAQGDAARSWGISLGLPLAERPIVATALDLLALAASPLPVTAAMALMRSPYLPGDAAVRERRAGLERVWRRSGVHALSLPQLIEALSGVDAALAQRFQALPPLPRGNRSPADWALAWRDLLAAGGWPGERPLDSAEWQTRDAWLAQLAAFATCAAVVPALRRDEALAALQATTREAVFQPEGHAPRIQLLGLLEAAGLRFDALWIAGLTADRWPPAPTPNPLLPLAWQRERGVPRADAARDLVYAQRLTADWPRAAAAVVASHGRIVDGQPRSVSALILDWPPGDIDAVAPRAGRAAAIAAAAPALERRVDTAAPAVAPGVPVRGGAGLVESQSACPFQAFARYRLDAQAWPPLAPGLTAAERGTVLHAALAALWENLADQAALLQAPDDALAERLAAAARRGLAALPRARLRALPAAVAAGEEGRLRATIGAWIDHVERARAPFAIAAIERRMPLTLGGLALTLKLDRVDRLADGGVAIIDYKSGGAQSPVRWFAARPAGTQLGVYALAWTAQAGADPVRALAFASLKAGAFGCKGIAEDPDGWPGLAAIDSVAPGPQMDDATGWFAARLGALAADFRAGVAAVDPRDAAACRQCDLQPLCRIRTDGDDHDDGDAAGAGAGAGDG